MSSFFEMCLLVGGCGKISPAVLISIGPANELAVNTLLRSTLYVFYPEVIWWGEERVKNVPSNTDFG